MSTLKKRVEALESQLPTLSNEALFINFVPLRAAGEQGVTVDDVWRYKGPGGVYDRDATETLEAFQNRLETKCTRNLAGIAVFLSEERPPEEQQRTKGRYVDGA